MFSTLQTSNCTSIGRVVVETCGVGQFCCVEGCCTDYTYFLLLLIVISMIVIVAVFIHVEVVKERKFNEQLKRHLESCDKGDLAREIEDTRICLGASPIDGCPFNLPPSCSPPMSVPKLKLHKNRPIRHLLNKHL
ncbi:unnamed protein product [Caenorhabditis sp. 36 PRJEB53466]|nr:unnamed protein product [Caenorhabditis sp. 36 PRJEB53466]